MHVNEERHQIRLWEAMEAARALTHAAQRLYLSAAVACGEDSDQKAQASTIHMHAKKTEGQMMRYADRHRQGDPLLKEETD